MNIHEHQAKKILRDFGAPVSKGIVIFSIDEIKKKVSLILDTCGGDGCVREFSDLYLRKNKNI